MSLFFISFQKTRLMSQDDEGQDFPGLEEARKAAIASARELLADQLKFASSDPLVAVIIANEEGRELLKIAAKDILPESLK
jgi:hypothetical protein